MWDLNLTRGQYKEQVRSMGAKSNATVMLALWEFEALEHLYICSTPNAKALSLRASKEHVISTFVKKDERGNLVVYQILSTMHTLPW